MLHLYVKSRGILNRFLIKLIQVEVVNGSGLKGYIIYVFRQSLEGF